MGATSDSAEGCVDGCTRLGPERVVQGGMNSGGIIMPDGSPATAASFPNMNAHTTRANAIKILVPPGAQELPLCNGEDASEQYIKLFVTGQAGNALIGYDPVGGGISLRNRRGGNWDWWFWNELGLNVDWLIRPGSFQNPAESLRLRNGADELVRGAGVNILTGEDITNNHLYRDNSGAGGFITFVNRQGDTRFNHIAADGLSSGFAFQWRRWPEGRVAQQCEAWVGGEGCSPTTTPRFQLGCEETTDPAAWLDEFTRNTVPSTQWELSTDGGATYGPAPASLTHGAAIAGDYRWRATFTIPQGYGGWWRVRALESQWTSPRSALIGVATMDGVGVGVANVPSEPSPGNVSFHWHTDYIEVTAGAHVFEWEEPISDGTLPVEPRFIADYNAVRKVGRQVQILDCLNLDGTIANTRYYDTDGTITTIDPTSTLNLGICP